MPTSREFTMIGLIWTTRLAGFLLCLHLLLPLVVHADGNATDANTKKHASSFE
ncbi:uncharacterized protein METZ01_LOCUS475744, partial [marine metagenome]